MYRIRKIRNTETYKVWNPITGEIHSHHTSKLKAMKQIRLLNALDHGWKPTRYLRS